MKKWSTWAWLTGVSVPYTGTTKMDNCSTTVSGYPEEQWWREVVPVGRTWSTAPPYSPSCEGEMTRHVIIQQSMSCDHDFIWVVKDLE